MEQSWGTNQAQHNICVIKIRGNLELLTAEQLDEVIGEVSEKQTCNIIVDLHDVVYISSMGWGVFLSKIKEIREKNGDLKLSGMRPEVHEVFRVLEFDMFLKSYPSVSEAAQDFEIPQSVIHKVRS